MKFGIKQNPDVGASKEASVILGSLDRRLRNPAGSLVRFWGFALLLFIIYLYLTGAFNNNSALRVIHWLSVYGIYLATLEILRKFRSQSYDQLWFRILRIICNIFLMSWLLIIPSGIRPVLAFSFTVPIFATVVYLAEYFWLRVLMLSLTGVGATLGGIFWSNEGLSLEQFGWIGLALVLMYLSFDWFYKRAITHSENHLAEVVGSLPRTLDLQQLLSSVMQIAIKMTHADYGLLIVINPRTKRYVDHVLNGFSLKVNRSIEEVSERCSVLGSGRSFECLDLLETFNDTSLYHRYFQQRPRSILAEPLFNAEGEVLGVINVAHNSPKRFDNISKNDLSEFSLLISNAIENCFVHRELKFREARSRDVSEKFIMASNEDEVIKTLVNEVREQISHTEQYVLHKYDPLTEHLLTFGAFYTNKDTNIDSWTLFSGRSFHLKLGYGIAGHALEQRETIRVNNVEDHPWYVKLETEGKVKSLLVAPLFDPSTNDLYGTVSLQSMKESAFNLDDEFILANLTIQCSRALSIKKNIQQLREQGGRLRQILDRIRTFDLTASEMDLCKNITRSAVDLLGFNIARIRLMPPNERNLKTVAIAGIPEHESKELKDSVIPYSEIEPFLLEEYRYENSFQVPHTNPEWQNFAKMYFDIPKQTTNKLDGWRAFDSLISPLIEFSGEPVGILTLDVPKTGRKPDHSEMELINVYSNAASWMIELNRYQRRLKEQTSRANSFIETISELAKASDLASISETVVQVAVNFLSVEGCSLFRVVGNEIELINSNYLANFKKYRRRKPISDQPKCGLTSWVAARGEVLKFNNEDHKNHSAWGEEEEHLNLLPSKKCHSLIIAPVKNKDGKVIGVISLENKKTLAGQKAFDEDDEKRVIDLAKETGDAWQVIDRYKAIEKFEHLGLEDDLHDLINWYHSGVVLWIDSVNQWLEKGNVNKARELLPQLLRQAYATNYELKTLHTNLLTRSYEAVTLQQALQDTINTWMDRYPPRYDGKMKVNLNCPEDLRIPVEARSALVRVASLAFSNAINHSGIIDNPDIQVVVEMGKKEDLYILSVSDNGKGMDLNKIREGYGLFRMKQLVERLGSLEYVKSKLRIETGIGKGTKIIVDVSLDNQQELE